MRLTLIDRIIDLQAGQQITATKSLSLSEDYLYDHFPRFPVMPGVLMLESMYQTAAWLVRVTEQFQHSMVTLAEASNVKYTGFVEPGQTLVVTAQWQRQDDRFTRFKCEGTVDNRVAARSNLVLDRFNLATANPGDSVADAFIIKRLREKFRLLYPAANSETNIHVVPHA